MEGAETLTDAVRGSAAPSAEDVGSTNSIVRWKAAGLPPTRKPPRGFEVHGEGETSLAAAFAASSSRRATKTPA